MDDTKREALAGLLVGLVPANGSPIGNQSLRERFMEAAKAAAGHKNTGSALDVAFESLREELLQKGVLAKGTCWRSSRVRCRCLSRLAITRRWRSRSWTTGESSR